MSGEEVAEIARMAAQVNSLLAAMINRGLVSDGASPPPRPARQPDLREWAVREWPELAPQAGP